MNTIMLPFYSDTHATQYTVIYHKKTIFTVTPIQKYLYMLILSRFAAQRGLWPPHPQGFLTTHNDAPQLVGLLWVSDRLIAETST
jgi:hypothetical protein